MAERRAQVLEVDAAGAAVRALGDCSDCGGCGGRCNLFRSDAAGVLRLPLECFAQAPATGDEVLLQLPDGWLARSALRGYGVPLLGLLAGAALGRLLAQLAQFPEDACVLAGAVAGTFGSFTLSKGAEPQIAVRVAQRHPPALADPARAGPAPADPVPAGTD